jgi:hypothetical protein
LDHGKKSKTIEISEERKNNNHRVFDLARLFIENIVGTDNRDFGVMPQILAGFTLDNGGGTRAEQEHGVTNLALGQDQVA